MPRPRNLLEEEPLDPLDVDPVVGAPPPVPEVEVEGSPTIRSQRPPVAPPGRLVLNRMVPMVPAKAPPAPARAPLQPAGGGDVARLAAQLEESGGRLGSVEDLLGAQRHDRMVRDANSVGDALYGAFTRSKAAPVGGGPSMAEEFGARRALGEHEEESDPASEKSRAHQTLIQELLPGTVPPETLAKLSKAQLDKMMPFMKDIESSRAKRAAAVAASEAARTNKLADRDAQWEETRARDARQATEAEKRARIMASSKSEAANAKAEGEAKENYLEGYKLSPEASPSKEEARGIRKAQASTRTIQETARQIAQLYRKHGAEALPTAERALMESLVTDLQLAMKGPEMYQLGVLAGPDEAILNRMVPNVTNAQANVLDFFGGDQVIPKLQALEGQVARRFENSARSLGYSKAGAAGFAPETVKKFRKQGGVTAEDIEGLGKVPSGPAPWTDADQKRLEELEAKEKAGAIR